MDTESLESLTRVRCTVGEVVFEGLLLPKEGKTVVLKLDSGYNVGFFPKHVSKVQVLAGPVSKKVQAAPKVKQGKGLPAVKILHTGGTIASRVDYATGGVNADFSPEALLELFPELCELACIQSEFLGNMWSDDFRFAHFNKVAKSIHAAAKTGTKRFVVSCGTDFLHYLSAALCFILKDVPVGVLVVGAQRSSDRGSTDAGVNLVCAVQFLSTVDFQGVATCMHGSVQDDSCLVIPGTQVRKMHSSRRDAFRPVNASPLATVDYASRKTHLLGPLRTVEGSVPVKLPLFKEGLKVGLLYSRPQLFAEELEAYAKFDGLILAGSGLGHFPVTDVDSQCKEHKLIFKALEGLAKRMPVVMSTQAIYGRVHMDVYSPARLLQQLGVVGHLSLMTPETSYVKLAWLLSNYSKGEVGRLFMEDVVGELRGDESNLYW